MTARIDSLWRTAVKGARGNFHPTIMVDTELGVRGDRQIAIRKKPGEDRWYPKAAYFVCMNTPQMALEVPVVTDQMDPEYLAGLKERLGIEGEPVVQFAHNNYSLHDTMARDAKNRPVQKGYVSFINLASLRELEKFVGKKLDPRRFRMNVAIEGLAPFEELDWIPKWHEGIEITVGGVRFKLDDACERCDAIDANPETGVRDTDLKTDLATMMAQRGYKSPQRGVQHVMGFYGIPLENGRIRVDEELRVR